MLIEFLERLFRWKNDTASGDEAKRRLKLVIAHDRATLSPELMEMMRQEILQVVARYVEIDTSEMEFSLESNQRITALIANLPIRQVRRRGAANDEE
jgi:cell division topological specificity factor